MRPIVLGPNQPPERFYRGGAKIARFRGLDTFEPRTPEDWVGSVTTLFGDPALGLTTMPDGRPLAESLAHSPGAWLGPTHRASFGDDPLLLVKLLDAGQRLPVHAHPDAGFAGRHLGRGHGKSEAWLIVEGGSVHLGFDRHVERPTLDRWVGLQEVDAMLAAMHEVVVGPGDTVFVPAGLPHAIGEGVFLVELQEPEDLSVLMEWADFDLDGRADGHLGLGFDVALGCVDRGATPRGRVEELIRRDATAIGGSLLVAEADPFFRAELVKVAGSARIEPGYSVLVVLSGAGTLTAEDEAAIDVGEGATVLVPHAAGGLTLAGRMDVVRCRPPLGDARHDLS